MVGIAARKFRRLAELAAQVEADCAEAVDSIGSALASVLAAGGKVLVAGNGGSLAQAAHFAEECSGRFRADRPALAVIALADPSHITCVANDYGFDEVFARAVAAYARPGDALLLLTTSGNSQNLVVAAAAARGLGVAVHAFTGRGGGELGRSADLAVDFPGDTADEVQELHMAGLHALVAAIERAEPWRAAP
jgi:D-sedoheptulose 7-phosphate isomerase